MTPQQQQQQQQLPPFDLQAYISRYDPRSETSLQRLLFLAHHFHQQIGGSTSDNDSAAAANIARQAFELAVTRMQQTGNHRRYLEEYGAVESSSTPTTTMMVGTPAAAEDAPELTMTGGGEHHQRSVMGTPLRQRSESSTAAATTPSTSSRHQKHIIQHYIDYDPTFVHQSKLETRSRLETMEGRLGTAQSHLMKESIRSALLALAEFHRERGELREAWRRVARSREYCANGGQHTQVCLLLIELSVDLREWSSVRDTVSRAEHTVMGGSSASTSSSNHHHPGSDNNMHNATTPDPLLRQKLQAALGLSHLAERRYAEAARVFCAISPELTNQFHGVMSAEDLALYGSILGLATMGRGELHEGIIDGVFKGRLELVPAMREALRHYSRAEYGACLSLLQNSTIQRDLLLDIHLHSHVPALLDMIRDRCIVQYFRPYSSVSLERMGSVFACSPKEMEEVVAKLISNNGGGGGGVDCGLSLGEGARINAKEKTLSVEPQRSVERRERRRARVRAAKMGVLFRRNAEGMIMRAACVENGITIQSDKRSSGWRNRSGGRGARDASGGRGNRLGGSGGDPYMGPTDPYGESDDESISGDDAMEIDNHIVNPNEF